MSLSGAARVVATAILVTAVLIIANAVEERWPISCWNATQLTLSFELQRAPCAGTALGRTNLWLREHRQLIIASGDSHHVAATAIAGAIAYEATRDVHISSVFELTRSSGPGKVHYKEGYFFEGDPVARQVEQSGYLPSTSEHERRALLATPSGAVSYIAAIMDAYSDIAAERGLNIRNNPGVLVTLYTSSSPGRVRATVTSDVIFGRSLPINSAGGWVNRHMSDLEDALCARKCSGWPFRDFDLLISSTPCRARAASRLPCTARPAERQ